jgi:formylglycine-generating enzyme required for sulfatase activity
VGKQLKALGMIDSEDPKVRRVMAELERKGWLSDPPTPPQAGHPWTNSLGMRFVPVPGTEALFCIWDTRVKDFEAFVSATGHDATAGMWSARSDGWKQRGDTWKNPGFSQGPEHPVCGVSWEDAKAFCQWLTEKERKDELISGSQSYRLPTDAEWSAAVGLDEPSGGMPKDKDAKIKGVYPWGAEWPPPPGAGNYAGEEAKDENWPSNWNVIAGYHDGYARTSPVGSFKPNRYGLYDMGGNVWQWCEDWYDTSQKSRVLRGASWVNFDPGFLLSSFRNVSAPGSRLNLFGFRVVLVDDSSR